MRQLTQIIRPVILSGGSGTRLWPLSRQAYPKQLIPLVGDGSLLQRTAQRAKDCDFTSPLVVCNHEHRFLVGQQLAEIGVEPWRLVIEPVGRNTAPAVAVAALLAAEQDPATVLLVLPSDHMVQRPESFAAMVAQGTAAAAKGALVTFGIRPTHAATGYGYIQPGEEIADNNGCHAVVRFVEKPDRRTAERFLAEGLLWNSGMFLFRADAVLEELATHQPEVLNACREAVHRARTDLDFLRLCKDAFADAPSISLDHAVMEKTTRAAVVGADIGWSDLGSWSALWEVSQRDGAGNAFSGDVVAVDTSDTLVHGTGRLVATLGVEGLVVVDTDDALLIADRRRAEDVKDVVKRLESEGRAELMNHRRVMRPWGCYRTLHEGQRFQVKEITVHPGAALSLQLHHHRAEHWVVVQGTAMVTRGEEKILLYENQSTYIPVGMAHRLHNPGKIPLRLIEVQSGAYLGEDDIVRLADNYGRNEAEALAK